MLKQMAAIFAALIFSQTASTQETLEVYIDADYTINQAAANSIESGVRAALQEANNRLGGFDVNVVPMDHRGNVRRSRKTMEQFIDSSRAIAMIGGLHSPPYLTHQRFMNQNGVLSLLPWSAAGPITRANEEDENWIFRLSVDDFQSGSFLVHEALETGQCNGIALVLLDTGWGRANEVSLKAALRNREVEPKTIEFFPSSIGKAEAGRIAIAVKSSGADCTILLANAGNGAILVNALSDRISNLRIFSHWGITGGSEFTDNVSPEVRNRMQILVLQTCGLKREAEGSTTLQAAMNFADSDTESLSAMAASTGFVHGYDLTKILLAAARQAAGTPEWQTTIEGRRRALKHALESLEAPVDGILKRYSAPFAPYSSQALNAHEALGVNDLCLARFTEQGHLENAG